MEDTIQVTPKRSITVKSAVSKKGKIFELIKKGFMFTDDVLQEAGIKHTTKVDRYNNVFVDRDKFEKKTYQKERESLQSIIKSLHTLDNVDDEEFNDLDTQDNSGDESED